MAEQEHDFGARLRAFRRERGWTQQQLADRAGLDRATISLIETGREDPRKDTILRLAGVLGRNPADFWRGERSDGAAPEEEAAPRPLVSGEAGTGYRIREEQELTYAPLEEARLHPGLEELLADDRTRLMLGLTEEEEQMLRSIRTRRDAPLTREFFIDVLISYRRHQREGDPPSLS